MKMNKVADIKLSVQIAPLIDVVFLLLIYFMVTATLIKKEGDIGFRLPVPIVSPVPNSPVEARISIDADGVVTLDGIQFDKMDRKLSGLKDRISGLQQMAAVQHSAFFVTLDPDQETLHSRIVDVLDACAASKVKNLGFAQHDV